MGLMTPICEFSGGKMAATIQEKFVSLELTDAAGSKTDTLRIDISSRGGLVWPETGKKISVKLGYKESGVRDMGSFVLSQISESLPQQVMTLQFTAALFQASDETEFKSRRVATFEQKTIGSIVSEIAGRHGFSPRVHADFREKIVDHINQDDETDMQFLHRLAKRFDAVCKPVDRFLVFAKRGEVKSLSGQSLTPVEIKWRGALSPVEPGFCQVVVTSADKQKTSGVKARWRNDGAADDVEVAVGEKPFRRLPTIYKTEAEALQNAEAELRKSKRHGDTLSMDCPGDSRICAEGLLTLVDFPSARANITWSCDRVTHSFSKSGGFRSRLEATLPGESESDSGGDVGGDSDV